jgi:Ni,Fe-hydrogenase III small subunit
LKNWFVYGIKKGVVTTKYPSGKAEDVAAWSTKPVRVSGGQVDCPTSAICGGDVNMAKCICCGRCSDSFAPNDVVELAEVRMNNSSFKRSFHIYILDAGSCGACNLEVQALGNPLYDLNRLGIFFTNTPRHADALLVVGVVADAMRDVLVETYEAIPEPKLVFAVGSCASSGTLFGLSVTKVLKTDIIVPGCPPNPYTILDALIRAKGGVK